MCEYSRLCITFTSTNKYIDKFKGKPSNGNKLDVFTNTDLRAIPPQYIQTIYMYIRKPNGNIFFNFIHTTQSQTTIT